MRRNRNSVIILNLMVLFIAVSSASAAVHLVPGDYPTIGAAIGACGDGDEIIVADGVYTGTDNCDFFLGSKVITIRSANGPDECIINCNGTAEQPHRAFRLGNNSRIVGFTIINGYADEGGAIYCEYNVSPAIINCVLTDNSAMIAGGAIYCNGSSPVIINCTIKGNSIVGDDWQFGGGGIYVEMSSINIINSRIIHNTANNGGGIYCRQDNSVTIKSCAINNNLAEAEGGFGKDSSYGGGIFCDENSNLTIIDSAICNNIVKGGDSGGGGLFFNSSYERSKLFITNCIINGNSVEGGWASRGGGICYNADEYHPAPFTIINCTVNGNSAKPGKDIDNSYGGGISCHRGSPIIGKCRISGNIAAEGGGISCDESSLVITGCIISGNSPIDRDRFSGGAIQCRGCNATINNCTIVGNSLWGVNCQGSEATVTNSIIYYNGDGRWDFSQIHDSSVAATYSNVQTCKPSVETWPGIGNINEDPCFVGPGYWDCNDRDSCFWVEGDYHLSAESACIDTGHITSYMLDDTDFDGNSRVSGNQIDMGVYEFKNNAPTANAGIDKKFFAWTDGIAKITLDGSGSFDPDGDSLTYHWDWIIAGDTFNANGVSPVIELPVGKHIIRLTVDDGIDVSEPDEVLIDVIGPIESNLRIFPRVINRHSRMKTIAAMIHLPEDVPQNQINMSEPIKLYPCDIEAVNQYIISSRRWRATQGTSIAAFFDKTDLIDAVGDNGKVELQVTGKLKSGRVFFGNSTISIKRL